MRRLFAVARDDRSLVVGHSIARYPQGQMKHFLLMYDLADNYIDRRGEFRETHLGMAWAAHDKGELVLGGAFTDPADTALLLFKAESKETVENFAENDPYVINGLVKNWRVREWNTVAGAIAVNPIKPKM